MSESNSALYVLHFSNTNLMLHYLTCHICCIFQFKGLPEYSGNMNRFKTYWEGGWRDREKEIKRDELDCSCGATLALMA